jgi:4a-hydroxytetrahydrobiopterin dehydratase
LSRKRALTCIVINLVATPGLGSIFARRYFAGTLQLLLALAGFCLTTGWMLKAVYNSVQTGETYDAAQPNWIWQWGTILFCVSWIWSLITSISLWREAMAGGNFSMASMAPLLNKLESPQITFALAAIPQWQKAGNVIFRTFQFKDFPAAIKFVNNVAEMAEAAWHHPDIDIRWNRVTLALTTHDAGGLTEKDFALAAKFDELSRS